MILEKIHKARVGFLQKFNKLPAFVFLLESEIEELEQYLQLQKQTKRGDYIYGMQICKREPGEICVSSGG